MSNFDINVYNNEDYAFEGQEWLFCPYTLVGAENALETGRELHKYNLVLTEEEVLQLGLEDPNIWDYDTWIDKDSLVREFGVSDRILEWIQEVGDFIDKQPAH